MTATVHPDFQIPWCLAILSDPTIEHKDETPRELEGTAVSNSMFDKTLCHPGGIRAQKLFRRRSREPEPGPTGEEFCHLLSLGSDLDGRRGRAHGGLNAVVLDSLCGTAARHALAARNSVIPAAAPPPATATLTVDYKFPLGTPGVIFVRAWVSEMDGRKVWTRGVIVDSQGRVCATAKGLFVTPKALL